MKNPEFGTETYPLTQRGKHHIGYLIEGARVHSDPQDIQLRRFGILRLSATESYNKNEHFSFSSNGLPYAKGVLLWSPKLLDLEPDQYQARVDQPSKGSARLGLVDLEGRYIGNIYPKNLRVVAAAQSGWHFVGSSHYLVRDLSGIRLYSEDSDRELLKARRGIRPAHLDNSPFARVPDEIPVGERFMYLRFNFTTNPIYGDDAVVIDPQTRSLVPKILEQPLAYAKWGGRFIGPYPHGDFAQH